MAEISIVLTLVATAVWVLFFLIGIKNNKYANAISHLNNSMFLLKDVYYVGFAILDTFRISTNKGFFNKKRVEMEELFGVEDAKRYNRSLWAGMISVGLTIMIVTMAVGLLANEPIISLFGIILGPATGYSMMNSLSNRVNDRREQILMDFPQVVSKLAMLLKAGMTIQDAWAQIAYSREGIIYREMLTAHQDIMNAGASMEEAYMAFARRCVIPETRKFAVLVIQNLKKGGSEMVLSLQELASEQWLEKKHMVLRKGELAGNKLLFPIMLMFIGVLILIMVPSFMQMTGGL